MKLQHLCMVRQLGLPNETSILKRLILILEFLEFSRMRAARIRKSDEGVFEKTSKFEVRMRGINLRILEDSRKFAYGM